MKTADSSSPRGPEGAERPPGLRPSSGMTLVEILVAFVVLILLVTALVSLATQGLETWSQGEARKDLYDRAEKLSTGSTSCTQSASISGAR